MRNKDELITSLNDGVEFSTKNTGGSAMNLSGSDRRFSVEKRTDVRIDTAWQLYTVEERQADRLLRTFTGRITQTQAARPTVREDIARWCELYRDRLPCDGEMVVIDLDYVQKL
jgi:hypothetical protein